jgi:hypothetical protein
VKRRVPLDDGRVVVLDGEGGEHAHWEASLDGQHLGDIRRFERRLNIRPVCLIRGWRASVKAPPGQPWLRLPQGSDLSCFDTQREAVEALVKSAGGK